MPEHDLTDGCPDSGADELYWGLSCPACTQPRAFERPPCPDGHGADCPERVCTGCGTALLVGATVGRLDARPGAA